MDKWKFFAHSVPIKLVLLQAAQLKSKISSVAPLWGTLIKDSLLMSRGDKKKAQHPTGSEDTASRILLCRHVLYLCATTAAQNGQEKMFQLSLPVSESLLVVKHAAYLAFWLENHIQIWKSSFCIGKTGTVGFELGILKPESAPCHLSFHGCLRTTFQFRLAKGYFCCSQLVHELR